MKSFSENGGERKFQRPALPSDAQDRASVFSFPLVIDENDAFRGDCAFRQLEWRRDRAIGKQSFSASQRNRNYLQPQGINQIMLQERLNQIGASINVQVRPFLLLDFADFVRNISV